MDLMRRLCRIILECTGRPFWGTRIKLNKRVRNSGNWLLMRRKGNCSSGWRRLRNFSLISGMIKRKGPPLNKIREIMEESLCKHHTGHKNTDPAIEIRTNHQNQSKISWISIPKIKETQKIRGKVLHADGYSTMTSKIRIKCSRIKNAIIISMTMISKVLKNSMARNPHSLRTYEGIIIKLMIFTGYIIGKMSKI